MTPLFEKYINTLLTELNQYTKVNAAHQSYNMKDRNPVAKDRNERLYNKVIEDAKKKGNYIEMIYSKEDKRETYDPARLGVVLLRVRAFNKDDAYPFIEIALTDLSSENDVKSYELSMKNENYIEHGLLQLQHYGKLKIYNTQRQLGMYDFATASDAQVFSRKYAEFTGKRIPWKNFYFSK
jgi:hypothetical protein